MSQKFTVANLTKEELAKQLKKPIGNDGKQVAKQMNKGNKHICLHSYKILHPKPNSLILEIGMGNGFFIKDLLSLSENLKYVGLDFSKTMIDEATALNQDLIDQQKVSFIHGSIDNLPFENESIDCITTTNTIYFWPNLIKNAEEIFRVLKFKGKILIGYRSKELMDKIELSKHGFNKYTKTEIEKLLRDVGFTNVKTEILSEPKLDFDGTPMEMEGLYTVGIKK